MRASFGSPFVLLAFAAAEPPPVKAEERGRFDLGLRVNIMAGDGEPTNDVPGFGLFGHLPLDGNWSIGFALDHSPEFDVERTARIVGFEQRGEEDEIDSKGTSTTLTAWIERSHGERFQWLWGVGAGVSDVEVDPLEGLRPSGVPFRVETDAGTEVLLIGNAGLRHWFGGARKWAWSAEIRLEQRWGGWVLREVRTGQTEEIDDYLLAGIHFGLSRRF
jgi:hypothetical protein